MPDVMECEEDNVSETSAEKRQVSCDDFNVYVCHGGRVHSSDVGQPVLGDLPFKLRKFERLDNSYYFLDVTGRLWCNSVSVSSGVRDFSEKFILLEDGCVYHRNSFTQITIEPLIARISGDLLIGVNNCLYDGAGQYLLGDIGHAHTDGNEILAVRTNGTLEYIGDNTDRQTALQSILTASGVKKAVVSSGSVLLLSHAGELVASGENRFFECGIQYDGAVDWIQSLSFPHPVLDFDFKHRVGWALLADNSVWVWGANDKKTCCFLQWYGEEHINPRPLAI
jgi:hypothetical protein